MHQNFRTRLSSSPVYSTNPVKLNTCRPGRRRSWMRPRRYTCLLSAPDWEAFLKRIGLGWADLAIPVYEPIRAFTRSSPTSSDTFPNAAVESASAVRLGGSWGERPCPSLITDAAASLLLRVPTLLETSCENERCQDQSASSLICLGVDI